MSLKRRFMYRKYNRLAGDCQKSSRPF